MEFSYAITEDAVSIFDELVEGSQPDPIIARYYENIGSIAWSSNDEGQLQIPYRCYIKGTAYLHDEIIDLLDDRADILPVLDNANDQYQFSDVGTEWSLMPYEYLFDTFSVQFVEPLVEINNSPPTLTNPPEDIVLLLGQKETVNLGSSSDFESD